MHTRQTFVQRGRPGRASSGGSGGLPFRASASYHRATEEAPHLEFRLLGRLEVRAADRSLELGGPLQRALLALLLLEANRVVPRERLLAELWDDAPPPSASSVLSTYVSRLRRVFAQDPDVSLIAEGAGYSLHVRPERIDARRFAELAADGRRALAAGDPERASQLLGAALALWAGSPLAELAGKAFARVEAARLEEARLAAREDRMDADLALGRHAELVGELRALVHEHPYRERLRAQLMLALYRSGRQAEALGVYQDVRRVLVGELGIEPGFALRELHRRILRQESSLTSPVAAAAPPALPAERGAARPRAGRRRPLLLAAGIVAVGAAAISALAFRPASAPAPVTLTGDSVAVVDEDSATVVAEVPVGGRPGGLAVGAGAVWVGNRDDRTLLEIEPASRRVVRTIGIGVEPREVAVAAGSVWVSNGDVVVRVDPVSGNELARVPVRGDLAGCCALALAGSRGVLFASRFGVLSRIDLATTAVARQARRETVLSIAAHPRALWALAPRHLLRLEADTGAVAERIPFGRVGRDADCQTIAAGDDAVWVGNLEGRAVWKFDVATGRLAEIFSLGRMPVSLAAGERAVWVGTADASLVRVDARSGEAKRIALGVYPAERAIAVGDQAVWISVTAI